MIFEELKFKYILPATIFLAMATFSIASEEKIQQGEAPPKSRFQQMKEKIMTSEAAQRIQKSRIGKAAQTAATTAYDKMCPLRLKIAEKRANKAADDLTDSLLDNDPLISSAKQQKEQIERQIKQLSGPALKAKQKELTELKGMINDLEMDQKEAKERDARMTEKLAKVKEQCSGYLSASQKK